MRTPCIKRSVVRVPRVSAISENFKTDSAQPPSNKCKKIFTKNLLIAR